VFVVESRSKGHGNGRILKLDAGSLSGKSGQGRRNLIAHAKQTRSCSRET
jgi:hypothetical protein